MSQLSLSALSLRAQASRWKVRLAGGGFEVIRASQGLCSFPRLRSCSHVIHAKRVRADPPASANPSLGLGLLEDVGGLMKQT